MTEERTNNGELESGGETERRERRTWEPNRQERRVKSKKAFDKQKMSHLVNDEKPTYKGELDPRKKDPDKKPRSISRSEEKVMQKAEKLAAAEGRTRESERVKITDFRDQYEKCQASPGRLGALYATQQVRRRKAFAQEVIEATIDRSKLSAQDRAFATLLTLGVVSAQGSLDDVINRALASPRDVKPDVRDALRISTYEVIYLRKAPHAAVDQGVELVRAVAPSASGLANAVLHRILDMADVFPFGDPAKDLDALALNYAFPTWLAKQLIEDMGAQAAVDLMRASNDPAPLFVCVNALKADDAEVIELFTEVGAQLEPAGAGGIEPAGCFRVSNSRTLADGRIRCLFQQGKLLVSDAAAQAVASAVLEDGDPGPMLEVGAGRGTKTIMLQSGCQRKFGSQTTLTSMDSHSFKSELLRERADSYGVKIDDIVTGNATRLDSVMPNRMFKTVFIDAPCSGLGTLRRHQEIRWRITPEHIEELSETGLAMLKSAASHVEVGGMIVYATCTVTYAENNGVVKAFLESEEGAGFTLAPINGKAAFVSQLVPDSPDAHFAVKFIRKA
ncbi:MAG: antitermination protein NusB [Eggerthellaceae bacterium]|nr:antitermination protein NusB [Eggerthellaceae bacterium]